jgi:hypothetical protein
MLDFMSWLGELPPVRSATELRRGAEQLELRALAEADPQKAAILRILAKAYRIAAAKRDGGPS